MKNIVIAAIEDDQRALTEAMLTGEVGMDDDGLCERCGNITEGDVYRLSGEILRYLISRQASSLTMAALATMRWHNLHEAAIYMRCSERKVKELLDAGKIAGSQIDDGPTSSWVIDRESEDAHLSRYSSKARIGAAELAQRGGRS